VDKAKAVSKAEATYNPSGRHLGHCSLYPSPLTQGCSHLLWPQPEAGHFALQPELESSLGQFLCPLNESLQECVTTGDCLQSLGSVGPSILDGFDQHSEESTLLLRGPKSYLDRSRHLPFNLLPYSKSVHYSDHVVAEPLHQKDHFL
jgi:hypothetical protein